MLSVRILAVGRLKEPWLRDGMTEYAKRLGAYCRFHVEEIEEYRLPDTPSSAQIEKGLEVEGREILRRVGRSSLVALCIEGRALASPQFATILQDRQQQDSSLALAIGSSFGLWQGVKDAAVLKLSLSPMTFPHQLARLMLAEQLYRGFSIIHGRKYHK